MDEYGADILRLWVMSSDFTEDLRIGKEILKQQAELYRRLRNTLRWLLGSLAGFGEAERLPAEQMPALDRWVLHRLHELDGVIRRAAGTYEWTGVLAQLHGFCAQDLSAFYFDVRKDAIYCDRPDSIRRRAARTVLDHLHRCLTTWLAPILCFTADEAWRARFGDEACVHLETWPEVPAGWRDEALAARTARIRDIRREVTAALEKDRQEQRIGSSLQASVTLGLPLEDAGLLNEEGWAELCIVSALQVQPDAAVTVATGRAEGGKCIRCWRVLPEVGSLAAHPGLCLRCADAVDSGLVCKAA
jgi:isoleucyl-tRNA synthetase